MRILLLTQFFPPVVGGEERHVFNLAAGLAGAGHEVHVATLRLAADQALEQTCAEGFTVHLLDHIGQRIPWAYQSANRPLALPIPDPVTTRRLDALLDRLRPDVVHAHNWIVNSALGPTRRSKVPLVLTLHDYSHSCATKRLMFHDSPCAGPALKRCLPCSSEHFGAKGPLIYAGLTAGKRRRQRRVARFVPVSDFVEANSRLGSAAPRSTVVTNFIPDELIGAPMRARDAALPPGPYVFFAGDLSRNKGVHTLLAAHERLGAGRPALVLVGRAVDAIPDRVAEDVVIGSEWPHERVVDAFQHCTVAALPSEWPDPCPTTVLEAMALGAPLVTTRMGGIASLVEPGVSALTVPPGRPDALAGAIGEVLANDALAAGLRVNGPRRAAQFTRSAVVQRLGQVYSEACAKRV